MVGCSFYILQIKKNYLPTYIYETERVHRFFLIGKAVEDIAVSVSHACLRTLSSLLNGRFLMTLNFFGVVLYINPSTCSENQVRSSRELIDEFNEARRRVAGSCYLL